MLKICLKIEIKIDNLDDELKLKNVKPVAQYFHADLFLEKNYILLKIYYDDKTYFGDKYIYWQQKDENSNSFLKKINIISINSPKRVKNINFSHSKVIWYQLGSNNYQNGVKFIPIKLNQIEIEYNPVYPKKRKNFSSEIFLSDNAIKIFNEFHTINAFISNKDSWISNNCRKEFQKFGELEFRLDYFNETKFDEYGENTIIVRKPFINIKHQNLSFEIFKKYVTIFQSLFTLYGGVEIGIKFFRHHCKISTYTMTYENEHTKLFNSNKILHFKKHIDIYELISKSTPSILETPSFLAEIVKMYNLSRISTGSTEFLLLFSIIEKLRNKLLNTKTVKEKFDFIISNKMINIFILEKLTEIEDKIKTVEQKNIFRKIKNNKLGNIKYLPQTNQFEIFFMKSNIDLENYQLSMSNILSIRNDIFHGRLIADDDIELKILNKKMGNLTLDLIFKYLNVNNAW